MVIWVPALRLSQVVKCDLGERGMVSGWRNFVLESLAQESFPPNHPELATQLINPLIRERLGNTEQSWPWCCGQLEQPSTVTGSKKADRATSGAAICLLPQIDLATRGLLLQHWVIPYPFSFHSFPSVFLTSVLTKRHRNTKKAILCFIWSIDHSDLNMYNIMPRMFLIFEKEISTFQTRAKTLLQANVWRQEVPGL